jgi:hypothetical protein
MHRLLVIVFFMLAAMTAGLLPAAAASQQEPNTNRPGGDFTSFEMRRPVPAACAATCEGNPRCMAWTFVKPGIQGRRARCWLKGSIPAAVPDSCCVSGRTRLMQFPGKMKLPKL